MVVHRCIFFKEIFETHAESANDDLGGACVFLVWMESLLKVLRLPELLWFLSQRLKENSKEKNLFRLTPGKKAS